MESGQITGLSLDDLDLAATLSSGQAFRWKWNSARAAWQGMLGKRRVWLSQSLTGDTLFWQADGPEAEDTVRAFLRLDDVDLPALAEEWCKSDSLFAEAWTRQAGVRILRQEPEECFFSFMCASVAPIARIGGMLRAVADDIGEDFEDDFIAFPSAATLAQASEERLRELGLGFRARRVALAARILQALPSHHLSDLRTQATHEEAKAELGAFFGVGEKIADCVCLFSLDKDGAIPVDTHIWRIACTRYVPSLAGKSLTPANYSRVVSAFHDRFGPMAGWAQQTLFYRAAVIRR